MCGCRDEISSSALLSQVSYVNKGVRQFGLIPFPWCAGHGAWRVSAILELVRDIHLNPLRVGAVKDMSALKSYPWSGRGVLMGSRTLPGQNLDKVMQGRSQRS